MAVVRAALIGLPRAWVLGAIMIAIAFGPEYALIAAADSAARMLHAPWLLAAAQFCGNALEASLGFCFATVAALELRIRTEGRDIELILDDQSARTASPTANSPGVTTSQ